MLGFLASRRESCLLETTRLDALPAKDQRCTICVNVLKHPTTHARNERAGEATASPQTPEHLASPTSERSEDQSRLAGLAKFRCQECRFAVMCKGCVADAHRLTPFHRIEASTSSYL